MFDIVKSFDNKTSAVLEHCDGSLEDLLKEREDEGFSEKEIHQIITSLAKSLEYVHSQGIIHGDLKPENILFKNEGGIKIWKLGEFG